MRIPDDEKGVTARFEMFSEPDPIASKLAGRPKYKEYPLVRVHLAANKQTVFAAPAHAIAGWVTEKTEWGEEKKEITYAQKYNKQYLEFMAGDKQSFNGTLLSELPFLTSLQRRELAALNIHTAETLASLDGTPLKQIGPHGRDLKNQALAYIEKAAKGVDAVELASELSKRDAEIEALKRQIASIAAPESAPEEAAPVKASTVQTFETFEDDDIRNMLTEAGVAVDGRWSRNTLIAKAEEHLIKKPQKAAA